jgi:uncharacterized Fe-S radical SAM superfamily protein PflX
MNKKEIDDLIMELEDYRNKVMELIDELKDDVEMNIVQSHNRLYKFDNYNDMNQMFIYGQINILSKLYSELQIRKL